MTLEQMELKLEQAIDAGDYDFIEYWNHCIDKLKAAGETK
jgi:hypothetical protein